MSKSSLATLLGPPLPVAVFRRVTAVDDGSSVGPSPTAKAPEKAPDMKKVVEALFAADSKKLSTEIRGPMLRILEGGTKLCGTIPLQWVPEFIRAIESQIQLVHRNDLNPIVQIIRAKTGAFESAPVAVAEARPA